MLFTVTYLGKLDIEKIQSPFFLYTNRGFFQGSVSESWDLYAYSIQLIGHNKAPYGVIWDVYLYEIRNSPRFRGGEVNSTGKILNQRKNTIRPEKILKELYIHSFYLYINAQYQILACCITFCQTPRTTPPEGLRAPWCVSP